MEIGTLPPNKASNYFRNKNIFKNQRHLSVNGKRSTISPTVNKQRHDLAYSDPELKVDNKISTRHGF